MWDAVSAISSAISAVLVVVAVIYAALQVREARTSRSIDTLLNIHAQFQSGELSEVRRQLHNDELGDVANIADAETQDRMVDFLNQLQLLGLLVEENYLDADLVKELFPGIPLTWQKALPYTEKRRQIRPVYGQYIEKLAQRYP